MKVLCIGDSLALPRPDLLYEDTWICKLKKEFPEWDIISISTRGITTNILVTQGGDKNSEIFPSGSDTLEFYLPKFVIIQLGIVDCAPRLIIPGSFNSFLVKILPSTLREFYLSFLKKVIKRKRNRVYVDKKKFKLNILNYLNRCRNCNIEKVIIIGIAIPDKKMEDKNHEMIHNVNEYNNIYKEICMDFEFASLVFPLNVDNANLNIYFDGYHPNSKGNLLVYNAIMQEISKFE